MSRPFGKATAEDARQLGRAVARMVQEHGLGLGRMPLWELHKHYGGPRPYVAGMAVRQRMTGVEIAAGHRLRYLPPEGFPPNNVLAALVLRS